MQKAMMHALDVFRRIGGEIGDLNSVLHSFTPFC